MWPAHKKKGTNMKRKIIFSLALLLFIGCGVAAVAEMNISPYGICEFIVNGKTYTLEVNHLNNGPDIYSLNILDPQKNAILNVMMDNLHEDGNPDDFLKEKVALLNAQIREFFNPPVPTTWTQKLEQLFMKLTVSVENGIPVVTVNSLKER